MLSVKDPTAKDWKDIATRFNEANFLQSKQWQDLHEKLGMKTTTRILYDGNEMSGFMLVVVKDAKRGRYLEIAGGPLFDSTNLKLWEAINKEIQAIGKKYDAVFARVRLQTTKSNKTETLLINSGYKKAPMHLHAEHTSVIDLEPTVENLLENMRRQTRYEVKKSKKQDITVQAYPARDKISQFIDLQQETAKRQGFITSSPTFLKALTESFGDSVKIYVSEHGGDILNMALVILQGKEAVYFEAASSEKSYKFSGSYALLWQLIQDAKKDGYERLNLWGIAYNDDPQNRYAGVTTFKRGFGGQDITYMPAHDFVFNKTKYLVNWTVETARRKKRRL